MLNNVEGNSHLLIIMRRGNYATVLDKILNIKLCDEVYNVLLLTKVLNCFQIISSNNLRIFISRCYFKPQYFSGMSIVNIYSHIDRVVIM